MKVKQRARRAFKRRGPTNGMAWIPIGFYRNRPALMEAVIGSWAIGHTESFRILVTPVLP